MTTPWYHKTTIYQIYPRSFYDSNNDGIGDLKGILQKLDYLHELGFETVWLSPFFSSPQADFGYDISDYTDIAPEYGTMDDALQLIGQIHKRGMRIILDMVMNHTSDQHAWFLESRSSQDNAKADWYLWRSPSSSPQFLQNWGEKRPNNWKSMTGGSGWHYAKERDQYYWSSFLPFQPDLNYRNPEVKKAMLDIVRFWLGKGVDGFRLDIFNVIYKDAEFRNNPFALQLAPTETNPSGFFQEAKYTMNQPESFAFAKELRTVCNEFGDKLLLGEISGDRETTRKFLGEETNTGLTHAFDFDMLTFKFTAEYFYDLIKKIEAHYPDPFMPVYVFGNHDRRRSINRIGEGQQKAKLIHMLQLTIRGVPCMYYGEELGMTNLKQPFATALDPIPHKFKFIPPVFFDIIGLTINRDEVRTPMQWDNTKNAGFSSAEKTWLPVHRNYKIINVEQENGEKDSLLHMIRTLGNVRKEEATLREGSLELMQGLPSGMLGYARILGDEKIFILLNFDEQAKEVPIEYSECILKLSDKDIAKEKAIRLNGFSGVIIK